MITGNKKPERFKLSSACCFYAGKGHFLSIAGRYIIDRVEKGSKVMVFADYDVRGSLIEASKCFSDSADIDRLDENIVQFPCKSISEILENRYFGNYLSKLIRLLGSGCKEEGLVVCIHDASEKMYGLMEEIESMLKDLKIPVLFINCFSFVSDRRLVSRILKNHDYILRTSGLKKIEYFGNNEVNFEAVP